MDAIGYAELRREQAERRAAGQLMGIGVASFTEALVGGPSRLFNILAARLVDPNASVGRVSAQYPFGSHICVVDLDGGSGELTIRRLVGVHGIGHQIDPLVLQGQIAGPLQSGFAPALYEEVVYDEFGGNLSSTLLSYAIPRAPESPDWEPEPRPPHGDGAAERISPGESPSVGAQVAIANAVVDALWHLGVRHVDIPITPSKVWSILRELEARMPASSGNARETHLTH
jgi:CO/xanthine dehydrogenase Mo-binding subunit